MDLGFDLVVTLTGIVLVFLILILLMAIITLEGKIFDSMDAKKKAAKEAEKAAKAASVKPAAAAQPAAAAPAPQVEEGIPGDVVAAIMAAIHAMGNGKYTLRAVRRSKNGWGNAGVNDTTAPFYSIHPTPSSRQCPSVSRARRFVEVFHHS